MISNWDQEIKNIEENIINGYNKDLYQWSNINQLSVKSVEYGLKIDELCLKLDKLHKEVLKLDVMRIKILNEKSLIDKKIKILSNNGVTNGGI